MLTGGFAFALHDVAVQIHHNDILRCQGEVIHAARADCHKPCFRVVDADIAAGTLGQAVRDEHFQMFNNFLSFLLH